MTSLSTHALVRRVQELARTRKVSFDNSTAFLFNQTHLNEQHVIDILCNATEAMVTVHHDRSDLNKYSVTSAKDDIEIFLDADVRNELTVRALLPLDYYK